VLWSLLRCWCGQDPSLAKNEFRERPEGETARAKGRRHPAMQQSHALAQHKDGGRGLPVYVLVGVAEKSKVWSVVADIKSTKKRQA